MAFPVGWARRCAIVIGADQVAGTGTLSDFPVCLTKANLPSEMLDKDGSYPAQMGGGDIRFSSDSAGTTLLPCHVLEFIPADDPANGQALIYVGVDLSGTVDTTIYVWYSTATRVEQPKYNANTDADGFRGSDYVWANYDIMLALGGHAGLNNLKQANASKQLGRYGPTLNPKLVTVAANGSGNTYCSFPSLVYIAERLYCSVREATAHTVTLSGDVAVKYSDDLGKTWSTDAGLSVADASFDLRDPQMLAQSDGTLWLFYTKTNAADTTRVTVYRKASAPYSSWGAETTLTTQTKAQIAGKPTELASGRIVVPCYDIDGSANTACFVRWSDDDGSSWTTDYLTSDGAAPGSYADYNEFSVAEDPGTAGNLVAIIRRNSAAFLYRQTSTDSGETWSAAASNITIDSAAPDMPEIQYCQDGDLLLAYAKDRASPEYQIVRSTDHGATWQSDFAILWNNSAGTTGEPDGLTNAGGYCSFVEVYKGQFVGVFYHDSSTTTGRVYCTPFSKVEDGAMNFWGRINRVIAGEISEGIELDDTSALIGNASLDWFNAVHNGSAFTISGWAKFNQTADELHCFAGSAASIADKGFFFGYENRVAAGSPNALRLFKSNGSGALVNNTTAAVSGDTAVHRWGVYADATSVPTFIKDSTTYAGTTAITATAGNASLSTRVGGTAFGSGDLSTGRLDGWMEMWGFSSLNLGTDYEITRYNSEADPATFAAVGTPANVGQPTLSLSTYKPGTLTSSGWTPRVTAS